MRPSLLILLSVGCTLPVSGLSPEDAGARRDAGPDGGRDAGPPLEDDAGPIVIDDGGADAGGCPPGRVDADGDPTNGCECTPTGAVDLCNGVDDDCDLATPDGAGEPWLGSACDGDDADRCEEGVLGCVGGSMACDEPLEDSVELCATPGDEDCDGATDEAGAADARMFYRDNDSDTYGGVMGAVRGCVAPLGFIERGGDCDDTTPAVSPGVAETCNGRDDDCSGLADDNGGCAPCRVEHDPGGAPYMFCNSNPQGWSGARAYCAGAGYRLVVINDSTENAWVAARADAIARGAYWIGLSQGGGGGWGWVDGTPLGSYHPWASGEPNNGGCCATPSENCGEIHSQSGQWNDYVCDWNRAFVCERP